ncbi:MAG: TIGR03546 family protein [Spirochaetaceae bacterium]|nr:TIGR03546 family protein [Spirochaetaceae bacterium]
MLNSIIGFLKSLNDNSHPGEIAHAASIGVILGLMPKDNVLWYILLFVFLFFRINKAVYLLVILGVSMCAPLGDMLFDKIGYAVLTFEPFTETYRILLDIPFVAYTKFNNTVVMGSLVCSLVLYIPVYLLTRILVRLWRKNLAPKISSSKFWNTLKNFPLVRKILSVSESISEVAKK